MINTAIPLADACPLRAAVMMVWPGVSPVLPRQWHHPILEHHNPGQPRLLRTVCSLNGKGTVKGNPLLSSISTVSVQLASLPSSSRPGGQ
jgi:hypothetical protein